MSGPPSDYRIVELIDIDISTWIDHCVVDLDWQLKSILFVKQKIELRVKTPGTPQ